MNPLGYMRDGNYTTVKAMHEEMRSLRAQDRLAARVRPARGGIPLEDACSAAVREAAHGATPARCPRAHDEQLGTTG